MVKNKKPRRKRKKAQQPQNSAKKILPKLVAATVTVVSLVLAVVGIYYEVEPKLSIEPESPFKTERSINVPFKITNQSVLPVYDIDYDWNVAELKYPHALALDNSFVRSRVDFPNVKKLNPGESMSVEPPPDVMRIKGGQLNYGDMTLTVKYKTAILSFQKSQMFRFFTRMGTDNNIHWYPKASEP